MAKDPYSRIEGRGGGHAEARERERLFQQYSAEIQREARDANTLASLSARVLSRVEVQRDAQLAGMLRGCLAQRETELRARADQQRRELASRAMAAPGTAAPGTVAPGAAAPDSPADGVPHAGESGPGPRGTLTLNQVRDVYQRLRSELDELLLRYDVSSAGDVFTRMLALQRRYPDAISAASLERARVDVARVAQRGDEIRADIEELVKRAVSAAQKGAPDQAARALQRLSSLHHAQPGLLSGERFAAIRAEIQRGGEVAEQREFAGALLAREKAVAAELKTLLAHVRSFHELARNLPHTDPRFQAAEQQYLRDVKAIHSHDAAWLADLMLELDDLLESVHDPTGRAEQHVSHFIESVRAALRTLHDEARAIAREERARRGAPPGESQPPGRAPDRA